MFEDDQYEGINETGLYRVEYKNTSRWELWVVSKKGDRNLMGYATARWLGEDMFDEYIFMKDVGMESVYDIESEDTIIH